MVYKVKRVHDDKIYVQKKIDTRQMSAAQKHDAVVEASLLAKLDYIYICKYKDSYKESNSINIIMEYCENGDLGKYLKKQMGRPLEEAKIWKFFIEMSLALHYLHSFRILHRDIKTINMFLGKDNIIKIGDLGVAKQLKQTCVMANTMVGTPYYLSPELCEDNPYNQKTDIWSLGCVLYELCTFKHPFEATNQGALIMKIVRAKFNPIPTNYSQSLKALVDQLLQKDQKKRPGIDQVLKFDFMRERMKLYGYDIDAHHAEIAKLKSNEQRGGA